MKSIYVLIFILFSVAPFSNQTFAQATQEINQEEEIVSPTLYKQFQTLKEKSNTYQEYKVVRITSLNNFWESIKDSIDAAKKDIRLAQEEIKAQKVALQKLQQDYNAKENELQKGDYEKAHITVMGMDVLKEKYVSFNIIVIFLLLAVVGVLLFKYNGSKRVAIFKTQEYNTIDRELTEHKQKAREREIKIKRELQTEMNRVEELNQELASLRRRTPSKS